MKAEINLKWNLILAVVRDLNTNMFALTVEGTIVHHICYMLTVFGADMGFRFERGTYGPYSQDVNEAMKAIYNMNLAAEVPRDKMIEVCVSEKFTLDKTLVSEKDMEAMEKTCDMFSRMRNTTVAEIFTTIVYSYNELKQIKESVSEAEIREHVLAWKPHWGNREVELNDYIRASNAMGWIQATLSRELEMADDMLRI